MPELTPQQVIAQVLHHIEDEGHTDETALAGAEDVIHALRVAGYEIDEIRLSAQEKLLADVRAAVSESGIKQVHIAHKIGVTAKHMSQIMTGKVGLSLDMAEAIVGACGRQLDVRIDNKEAGHG